MNIENKAITPIDITYFDAVSNSAKGHSFELKGEDGITGVGFRLLIQGKHADEVAKWNSALYMATVRERQMADKAGKQPPIKSLDELHLQNIEGTALRVIGWENVTQPFSRDLMQAALKRNPHWIPQIVAESDDLANFTKEKSST